MSTQLTSPPKAKARVRPAPKTPEAVRAARKIARDEDAAKHRLFSEKVQQTKVRVDELLAFTQRLLKQYG